MSGGLTYWWAKDAAWWRRGGIVRLLAEFGPTGPAVIDYLSCEAKAQNDGGLVTAHPYAIAHGINADDVTVSHVVSRSVTLGLLDDYEQHADRFSCRLSGWSADQERVSAAERKAAARARALAAKEKNGSVEPNTVGADVTVSHGESRDVPKCPLTGTGTGTEEKTTALSGGPDDQPRGTADELAVFAAWIEATGKTGRTQFDTKRRRFVRAALKAYPLTDVLDAVVGWKHDPHNRGENDRRTAYNDLTLVLRDAEHIEKFRDLQRGNAAGGSRFSHHPNVPPPSEDALKYDRAAGLIA